jgi:hypothetical protein
VTSYTYSFSSNDFLFLASPLPGDSERADQQKSLALKAGYKMDGLSFTPSN